MATDTNTTYAFQAEINQLLSLIIHTFYKQKDIFIRELLSNASDAIDKYRVGALQKGQSPNDNLRIRLVPDKVAKTLSFEDNGVGMSRDELVQCLGVIANSGSRKFMEAMMAKDATGEQAPSLIGQFGVGFYSAYLVADHVRVLTHQDGHDAYVWESNAGGTFDIRAPTDEEEALVPVRGTRIVLHLKEDELEFLQESRIREVVKQHTAFLSYPIYLEVERDVPVPKEDADASDASDAKEGDVEDAEAKPDEAPKTVKTLTDEQLNTQAPIWTRPAAEVTPEAYKAFYKAFTNDWQDPIAHTHFSVEGQLEFKGLLYIPTQPPHDLFQQEEKRKNVQLFVRRVFITDDSEPLIPEWLRFVKGLVDSNDLPLNISRETIQNAKHSSVLKTIKKNIVKKSIEMMTRLAEERPDDYITFYKAFGKCLKLGIYEEDQQRNKLVSLIRFTSAKHPNEARPVQAYRDGMKEGQKSVFYITGESQLAVLKSPHMESLLAKGYDVLFMTDPMDEYMMSRWREWEDLKLVNITKSSEELDAVLKVEGVTEDTSAKWKPLCDAIKAELSEAVERVVVSQRLVSTPVILVSDTWGHTANMERIMRAQALTQSSDMQFAMRARKILEINVGHRMITELEKRRSAGDQSKVVKDWIRMLYDTANLHSGFSLDDASGFVQRIHRLLEVGLCADAEEEDVVEDVVVADANADANTSMEDLD